MEEIWKDVVGWEGIYKVSNLGRVRSLDRHVKGKMRDGKNIKGKILFQRYDKDGYLTVHLRDADSEKNKLCKVHRIVAEAFIPKIEGKDSIDHINSIRDDNRVENLRWCTVKENASFPMAKENKSIATKNSYDKYPKLRRMRSDTLSKNKKIKIKVYKGNEFLGFFDSILDFSNKYNLIASSVYGSFRRNRDYKGYILERV